MKTQYIRLPVLTVVLANLGLLASGPAAAQGVYTPISNLNQPYAQDYSVSVFQNSPGAVSFTTGNTPNFFVSASINLGLPGDGPLALSLYNDAAGAPGISLAALSGDSDPAGDAVVTFTNSSPLMLSANTTYWIVASSSSDEGIFYNWLVTSSTSLDSGSIWPLGASKYSSGGGWSSPPGGYQLQFSLTVASTNLPAISIFPSVVLTYRAFPGLPLVLQQSSVLPGTSWVTVTNAIQTANVNTNQVFFIVPTSSQQMFFRLSVP